MVTHINVAVDDELAERARKIKSDNNWSWPVFFEQAVESLDDGGERENGE